MVNQRPSGPAAFRLQAAIISGSEPRIPEPPEGMRPALQALFGVGTALVVATTGMGILPLWASAALDLGAACCYLIGLRSALPHPPGALGVRHWLSAALLGAAAAPLTALLAVALALVVDPVLPWNFLLPFWLALVLGISPWLDASLRRGGGPEWGPTGLSLLLVTIPAPLFVLALAPANPAVLVGVGVGAGAAAPAWRLMRLAGVQPRPATLRALVVTAAVAASGAVTVRSGASGAVLPAAMLLGWYGLTGVCAEAGSRPRTPSAGFVVLAAALLALTAPA